MRNHHHREATSSFAHSHRRSLTPGRFRLKLDPVRSSYSLRPAAPAELNESAFPNIDSSLKLPVLCVSETSVSITRYTHCDRALCSFFLVYGSSSQESSLGAAVVAHLLPTCQQSTFRSAFGWILDYGDRSDVDRHCRQLTRQ